MIYKPCIRGFYGVVNSCMGGKDMDKNAETESGQTDMLQKGYYAILDFIDQMEQLTQLQNKIDITSNITEIWGVFLEYIPNLIDVETCALFLVDENSHEFVLKKVSPKEDAVVCQREIDFQIECGTFSWIINRGQPAVVLPMALKEKNTVIILPLCTVKKTLGVIMIATSIEQSSITQENIRLLTMLARQYALVIENALLYDNLRKEHTALEKANAEITILSITDPLTGIYNRGYLTERIPQEIKRAMRYGHALSVIMCDIDHFKKINDTYGHLAGDQVLKQFVQIITGLIRLDVDWVARYGGEEFFVVLPVTNFAGALHQAERLRAGIAKRPFDVDGNQIDVTASFGVTGFNSQETFEKEITPELIITTADKYLYEAKEQGRNRVVGGPVNCLSDCNG